MPGRIVQAPVLGRRAFSHRHLAGRNAPPDEAAAFFPYNQGVLDDPGVRATVMDGRAFLRLRPELRFDLVPLDNQMLAYGLDRLTRSQGRGRGWHFRLQREDLAIVRRHASADPDR